MLGLTALVCVHRRKRTDHDRCSSLRIIQSESDSPADSHFQEIGGKTMEPGLMRKLGSD